MPIQFRVVFHSFVASCWYASPPPLPFIFTLLITHSLPCTYSFTSGLMDPHNFKTLLHNSLENFDFAWEVIVMSDISNREKKFLIPIPYNI